MLQTRCVIADGRKERKSRACRRTFVHDGRSNGYLRAIETSQRGKTQHHSSTPLYASRRHRSAFFPFFPSSTLRHPSTSTSNPRICRLIPHLQAPACIWNCRVVRARRQVLGLLVTRLSILTRCACSHIAITTLPSVFFSTRRNVHFHFSSLSCSDRVINTIYTIF